MTKEEVEKLVIGLTGYHRSGKDTVAKYLKKEYGFEVLTFSDILKQRLKEKGEEATKMNMSLEGEELRKEKGNAAIAKELMKIVEEKGLKEIVLNGFISPEEVDYIRNRVMNFYLVEVQAAPRTRFERRSSEEPDNEEEFFRRDERDKRKGFEKVMQMDDYIVRNNSTIKDLHLEIDYIMADIEMNEEG